MKLIVIVALVGVLAAAGAGGAVWWKLGGGKAAVPADANSKDEKAAKAELKPGPDYKYVMLDKVLVMLRGRSGDAMAHYMALDIVFKALPEQEKRAKEHLPLLRTVAVKALSNYTLEAAQALSVSEVAAVLNKAYQESYASEQREPPFAEALIGKLIIE
ncbi:MAG: flagellar basal body protein [Methylibium sp.]|nr:flagellar basal body protein [Methylibium sp.]